ncbi:hypothetical protein [Qipengyuania sp. SM2507]
MSFDLKLQMVFIAARLAGSLIALYVPEMADGVVLSIQVFRLWVSILTFVRNIKSKREKCATSKDALSYSYPSATPR